MSLVTHGLLEINMYIHEIILYMTLNITNSTIFRVLSNIINRININKVSEI